MNQIDKVLQGNYDNRVIPFVWQKGEEKEVIEEYLLQIRNSDIREICIESRPHPDFVGKQWWEDMDYIIEKCKEAGMKIWFLDDSHFPTGYANGKVNENPSLKKKLLIHRTFDIVGPQSGVSIRVESPFYKNDIYYGTVLRSGDVYKDISNKVRNGILQLDLKEKGVSQVIVLFISNKSDFRDDYINIIDKDSCDLLISEVYEKHYERYKNDFGKTIQGFFTDEPGFMNEKGINGDSVIGKDMPLPWNEELEFEIQNIYSKDSIVQLSKLFNRDKNNYKIRYDYMNIVTNLYKKNFDERIGKWCRDRNVMHIGHVIEDKESHSRLGVGAGHFFRALSGQDMAGVDIVINQLVPGIDNGFHSYGRGEWDMQFFTYSLAKLGSSLGQLDPLKKGRTMAEVFGAFGWHEGLKLMKWIADHFLVRGVNYFVPHAFSQAEFPDVDCPPHFYGRGNNHQFQHFGKLMSYMNKMGTLLSGGVPKTTAAILYHAESEWCGEHMKIQVPSEILAKQQIDFQYVWCDIFDNPNYYNLKINKNEMIINNVSFKCLIIPYTESINLKVSNFIKKAVEIGFPVYFIDKYPSYIVETGEVCNIVGRISCLDDVVDEIKRKGLCDIQISNYQPWLRTYQYQKNGEEYFMFFNEHPKEMVTTVIKGLKGIKYDILNHFEEEFSEELILYPYESCLVLKKLGENNKIKLVNKYTENILFKKGWKLNFLSHEKDSHLIELGDIRKLENLNEAYPNQSGTYEYSQEFESEDINEGLLEIVDVYEVSEVFIDDICLGVRICPPYHYLMPKLKQGKHTLLIKVQNTLDKKVIDYFSTVEPIEPSGILGHVELMYNKVVNVK